MKRTFPLAVYITVYARMERDTRDLRHAPCLATRYAPFFSSADAGGTHGDIVQAGQPHAPRGAHTQRPNAFCNGDLWRETAEGPHDAPWITPPPGVRDVALAHRAPGILLSLLFSLSSPSLAHTVTHDRSTTARATPRAAPIDVTRARTLIQASSLRGAKPRTHEALGTQLLRSSRRNFTELLRLISREY